MQKELETHPEAAGMLSATQYTSPRKHNHTLPQLQPHHPASSYHSSIDCAPSGPQYLEPQSFGISGIASDLEVLLANPSFSPGCVPLELEELSSTPSFSGSSVPAVSDALAVAEDERQAMLERLMLLGDPSVFTEWSEGHERRYDTRSGGRS